MLVFPVDVFAGFALLYHRDAIGDGAHEVAAYAFFFFEGVGVVGVAVIEANVLWWLASSQAM